MRILLDTNILIQREDYRIIDEDLESLIKLINKLNVQIIVHPQSVEDIKKDKNIERQNIILSKLKTYEILASYPDPEGNKTFLNLVGEPIRSNDIIDNYLLYTVYHDAVNFLITEDLGIHKKASKLGISERVLSIFDAIDLLKIDLPEEKVRLPLTLKEMTMAELDVNDPIFNTLNYISIEMVKLTPQKIYTEYQKGGLDKASSINCLMAILENSEDESLRKESIQLLSEIQGFPGDNYKYLEFLLLSDKNQAVRATVANINYK